MSAPPKPGAEQSAATTETGRLGRYQLLQKLASGGMASVYLARAAGPAGFEKVIALKRIHPHLAEEKNFVDMFLDEARIASRIDHANVCSVFDFGEADGTYYIAMEFLAGEPFAQVAKQMARSSEHLKDPRRAHFVARMIADACEGLHAAHELRSREGEMLNVVHRDISPQNLFITYDGVVKVVDFGIASATDRLHHTQGSEVKGKFSYMAPEQARGTKGARLDRRADVFALGIVLWEMLALKRLFRRDTPAETLMALVHDPIPTPSSQRPGLTAEFDAIAMKALARNPDERYPTARELGRDLGKAIGKAGEVMGNVDLAEWMETLAPHAREKSRRQIEGALQGEAQRSSLAPPTEVSGSDIIVIEQSNVHARMLAARGAEAAEEDEPATQARSSPGITPPPGLAPSFTQQRAPSPPMLPPGLPRMSVPPPPPMDPTGRHEALLMPEPRSSIPKLAYIGGALALMIGCVGAALAVGMGLGLGRRDDRDAAAAIATNDRPAQLLAGAAGAMSPNVVPVPLNPPTLPIPAGTGPTANPLNPAVPGTTANPSTSPVAPGTDAAGLPTTPATGRNPRGSRGPRGPRGGGNGGTTGGTGGTGSATPPPATSALGTLIVSTPGGWANVFDRAGRLLGQTPLRTQLPAGTHTLSLRPFGQPPAISVSVTVPAGGTGRVVRAVEE